MHSPFWPPVQKWKNGKRGLYLSVLEEMDRQLGKLFDLIRDDEALRENTLVLVCSDNGQRREREQRGRFVGSRPIYTRVGFDRRSLPGDRDW